MAPYSKTPIADVIIGHFWNKLCKSKKVIFFVCVFDEFLSLKINLSILKNIENVYFKTLFYNLITIINSFFFYNNGSVVKCF